MSGTTLATLHNSVLASVPTGAELVVSVPINSGRYFATVLPSALSSSGTTYTFSTGMTNTSGTVTVIYGTISGTAAQGNDSRIVNAVQKVSSGTPGHLAVLTSDGSIADGGAVPSGAGTYTLPAATSSILGGVKAGTGLTAAGDGTLSITNVALSVIGQGGATTGQVLGWSGTAWGPTSLPTAVTPGSATARTTIADTDLIPWYDSAGTDYVALPTTLVSYILAKVDTPVAVTFSSTVTLNCQSGFARNFEVAALTGNVTIANPTNLLNGQTVSIRLPQDGTGGRTVTWGSMFKFTGGTKTLSTAASSVDRFVGIYSGNTGLIEGTLLLGIA